MRRIPPVALAAVSVLSFAVAAPAAAQLFYSVDIQGPSIGCPGGGVGPPIRSCDVLTPVPPGTPPPCATVALPGVVLGLPPAPAPIELDALSDGFDPFPSTQGPPTLQWLISVDEFAVGWPGIPAISVTTEAAAADAAADLFIALTGPGPLPPAPGPNLQMFDGNAVPPGPPGLSLFEPDPPTVMVLPDGGDNLDAVEWAPPAMGGVYFSLDAAFADPLEAAVAPPNMGSAAALGFAPGDVLVSAGGVPAVYAPAVALGLDNFAPGADDLDALILGENGVAGYQPVTRPYSWLSGTDFLLYSVRRGSAIIGMVDALLAVGIEEGDILIPIYDVVDGAPLFDGVEGDYDPGIFIAGEMLGLATVRLGTAFPWGPPNPAHGGVPNWADDLDALELQLTGSLLIFADGFETGSTARWSSVVP